MAVIWANYDKAKARAIAKKYGKSTVTQMMINIQKMNLVDKEKLLRSIKFGVRSTSGEVDRVQFSYEYYGKFHEIGVSDAFGKGVMLPKLPWRSEAMKDGKDEFDQEFADFYADLVSDNLSNETIKFK